LERFHRYLRHQLEARSGGGDAEAARYLTHLHVCLSEELSFEYLLRAKEDGRDEVVLLVVDDPRRAIVREKHRSAPQSPGKQPSQVRGAHGAVPLARARHPALHGYAQLP
jgi:hypothetical protein